MIYAPHMILIGASGRNSGKTEFACEVIRRFSVQARLVGAKVTAIQERDGTCPRGGEGCGVCASLEGSYCLTEETLHGGSKDTQRLLASGAHRVFWLRVMQTDLEAGARALLEAVGPDALVICESNSLRKVVEPGMFFMVQHREATSVKPSAQNVMAYVDRVVHSDGRAFDFDFDELAIRDGCWVLRNHISRM